LQVNVCSLSIEIEFDSLHAKAKTQTKNKTIFFIYITNFTVNGLHIILRKLNVVQVCKFCKFKFFINFHIN
jgi:hypothetical protein